jgi:hypothetical protein
LTAILGRILAADLSAGIRGQNACGYSSMIALGLKQLDLGSGAAFAAIVNAAMMREHGTKPAQARKGLIFNGY